MSRAGLVFAVLFAMPALCRTARAEEPAPDITWLGAQAGISGGASFARPRSAVNRELAGAGWSTLPPIEPALQIRFGLTVFDVTADLHIGGSLPGGAKPPKVTEDTLNAIGVDLGYRLRLGHGLALNPYVGIGSIDSVLCFAGPPDATSATSRPPFEQILRNPGRGTCLQASAVGLDIGLTFAWNHRVLFEKGKTDNLAAYLSIGPRLSYTMALPTTHTWSKGPSSAILADIPSFEGPLAPLGGAYAGIDFQFRFGMQPPR